MKLEAQIRHLGPGGPGYGHGHRSLEGLGEAKLTGPVALIPGFICG